MVQGDNDMMCKCWLDSFMCYRDCHAFPNSWFDVCIQSCTPEQCAPKLHVNAISSASALPPPLTAALVAVTAAVALALLPRP